MTFIPGDGIRADREATAGKRKEKERSYSGPAGSLYSTWTSRHKNIPHLSPCSQQRPRPQQICTSAVHQMAFQTRTGIRITRDVAKMHIQRCIPGIREPRSGWPIRTTDRILWVGEATLRLTRRDPGDLRPGQVGGLSAWLASVCHCGHEDQQMHIFSTIKAKDRQGKGMWQTEQLERMVVCSFILLLVNFSAVIRTEIIFW